MPTKSSPPLSKLQDWLRGVLTFPNGVGPALKTSKKYLHVIGETPQVSRETRLSIYGDGYFSRIIEVLGANFSSVKNTVGDHAFHHLARAYLIKYPSTFKSIDDVGAHLSLFLKKHSLTKAWPFLPDLAALEWAAHQSFFADDVPLLNPARFKNIPETSWQKARFELDPSVRLLKLNWPVDGLWRADGKWPKAKLQLMKKEPLFILVFRLTDKNVRVPRLSAAEFVLLTKLAQNKPLQAALSSLDDSLPVQRWFQEWIRNGVFKKITF